MVPSPSAATAAAAGRAPDVAAGARSEPAAGTARLLLALVFTGGFSSLAIELAGSRLLAPYFGTSLYIWAVLVGLILLYLTAGYFIGGRLGDRHPRPMLLFQLVAWAAFITGLIPVIARPILAFSAVGFADLDAGVFLGSLFAV